MTILKKLRGRVPPSAQSLALACGIAAAASVLGADAAFAGTDATFNTALTKFTNFLQGSGGKIITVLSLAGGIVGPALVGALKEANGGSFVLPMAALAVSYALSGLLFITLRCVAGRTVGSA